MCIANVKNFPQIAGGSSSTRAPADYAGGRLKTPWVVPAHQVPALPSSSCQIWRSNGTCAALSLTLLNFVELFLGGGPGVQLLLLRIARKLLLLRFLRIAIAIPSR